MSENGAKVIAGVREVAAERPDHVFGEMRVYVYADERPRGALTALQPTD
jgi:hypothetical protein